MKNYPLLTVKNKPRYYNWRNNYIRPLLNQVKDLSYYSYFIEPPYRNFIKELPSGESEENYENYDIITFGTDGAPNILNFNLMPIHSYIQLTKEAQATWIDEGLQKQIILPAGTWIVSEARNEGTLQLTTNFNNFIYTPGGYGSFYVLTDIVYNNSTHKYDMLFSYLRNAGEVYGYSPKSNIIFNTNRFVLKSISSPLLLEQKGKTVHSADLGTLLNNNSFTEWYTLGTPMHFFFNGNGEEVILDETHVINLEQANTHSYTINSKHSDVSMFYVDFI